MGRVIFDINNVTITSIYLVIIYPLVIFPLAKKSISYFTKELLENQQLYFNGDINTVELQILIIYYGW